MPLLATVEDVHVIGGGSGAAARLLARARDAAETLRTLPESQRAQFAHENYLLRTGRYGASTIDIGRICDAAFGDEIPKVVNATDVRQYEQVIHRDRSALSPVTQQSCDIGGGETFDIGTLWISGYVDAQGAQTSRVVRDATIADIYAPSVANGPQTDTSVSWPVRGNAGGAKFGRLEYSPRKDEPKTRHTFRVSSDGTCESVVLVVSAAGTTDRLFDGFIARDRPAAIVKTETALADRTTIDLTVPDATDDRPTTHDGWCTLLARLNAGDRANLGDVIVTVSRDGSRMSATFPGQARARVQRRSIESLATALVA
jgi:hypothetical protein